MTSGATGGGGLTKRLWFRALILPLFVLTLLIPLMALGVSPVLYLEGLSYDIRLAATCDPNLGGEEVGLIVKDDSSDEEVDLPFWPRELYEGALRNIGQSGCDVLGLDILFEDRGGTSPKSLKTDVSLAQSLSAGPAAILASRIFVKEDKDLGLLTRYRGPLPMFARECLSEGFINVNAEMGVVRSITLYRPHPALGEEKMVPSFALAVYLARCLKDGWSTMPKEEQKQIIESLVSSLSPFLREVRNNVGEREGSNLYGSYSFSKSKEWPKLLAAFQALGKHQHNFKDQKVAAIFAEMALRFLMAKTRGKKLWPKRWENDEALSLGAFLETHGVSSALGPLLAPAISLTEHTYNVMGPVLHINLDGFAKVKTISLVDAADERSLLLRHSNPILSVKEGVVTMSLPSVHSAGKVMARGKVLDIEGNPVQEAFVLFAVPSKRFGEARTDDRGRFAVSGLLPGTGIVSICHKEISYRGVVSLKAKENGKFAFVLPKRKREIKVKGLKAGEKLQVRSLSLSPQWQGREAENFVFPSCGTSLRLSLSAWQKSEKLAQIVTTFPEGLLGRNGNQLSPSSRLSFSSLSSREDEGTLRGMPRMKGDRKEILFKIDLSALAGAWSYSGTYEADEKGELEGLKLPLGSYEMWRGSEETPEGQWQIVVTEGEKELQVEGAKLPISKFEKRGEGAHFSIESKQVGKTTGEFLALPSGKRYPLAQFGERASASGKLPSVEGIGILRNKEGDNGVAIPKGTLGSLKTYLLGTMVQADQDFYASPVNNLAGRYLAGVEIHAAAVRTLMTGRWVNQLESPLWELLILFPYLIVAMGLCTLSLERSVLLWGGVTIGYVLLSFFAMAQLLWLPLAAPLLLLVLCPGAFLAFRVYEERKEAARRKSIFQKFINPQVVEELLKLEEVALHGERKELTILFSDIRGFTTISEQHSPQDVTGMLNEYFNRMLPILHKYEGTLDKFIGDAIMAFFGAPIEQQNHARRAVVAAIEMIHETRKLAKEREESSQWPPFKIGFGIATGPCQVGLIGSDEVFNYSVIGDTVNLAARLEGLNKTFKAEILVSEATWLLVEDLVEGCFVDEVAVKGKTEKVKVYQIIDFKGGRLDPFLV